MKLLSTLLVILFALFLCGCYTVATVEDPNATVTVASGPIYDTMPYWYGYYYPWYYYPHQHYYGYYRPYFHRHQEIIVTPRHGQTYIVRPNNAQPKPSVAPRRDNRGTAPIRSSGSSRGGNRR